ncbi:TonB-dependent receptor [bacterium]|nr:TonB-dependent receptor [bacterium]
MKQTVLLAGFVALGVVLGYSLITVPNVELVTATVFLCGYFLGIRLGILGGILTETIYGLLNPLGMVAPPLLAGMVLAMGCTGAAGGFLGRLRHHAGFRLSALFAAAGLLCTLNFAVLTTLGYLIGIHGPFHDIVKVMLAGLPFYFVHISVNTLIFFLLVPVLIRRVSTHRRALMITTGLLLISLSPGPLAGNGAEAAFETGQASGMNYRYLGDLAKSLPGVWIRDLGHNANWAGFRGYGSRTGQSDLLLNGFVLRDPVTGTADLGLIPVEMMRTMTVVTAGQDSRIVSPGGAISIESRFLNTERPYSKAVYRTGPNHFSDLDLIFGQKYTDRFQILSGVLLNNEGTENMDKYDGQHIYSTIQWQPLQPLSISYLILHNVSHSDLQYPVSAPRDSLITGYPNLRRNQADHMLRSTFHTGQWPVQVSWHYTRSDIRILDRVESHRSALQGRRHEWTMEQQVPLLSDGSWHVRCERQSLHKDSLETDRTVWQAGFGHRHAFSGNRLQSKITMELHHGTVHTAQAAARFDWRPGPLTVWTGFSRAVREPSPGEQSGIVFRPSAPENEDDITLLRDAVQIGGNPRLHAESAWTWDAGMDTETAFLQLQLRAYMQYLDDLIHLTETGGSFVFDNGPEQQNLGLESRLILGPWHGIGGQFMINLRQAERKGITLLEHPGIWGFAALTWKQAYFENDLVLNISVQSQFWNGFYSLTGYTLDTPAYRSHQPGMLLGAKVIAGIMQNGGICFSLDNVLDAEVSMADGFLLPGRGFRIGYYWELYD